MDLIQSIWLSSAAGAGLFFGAGLLVSRAFPPKDGAAAETGLGEAEKEALRRAEAQLATLQQQNAELTRSVGEERSRAEGAQKAQTEAQRLRGEVDKLQAEVNRARAAASGPSPAEAQLRQEVADLRQRLASADQAAHAFQAERARAADLEQRLAAAMAQAAQAGAARGDDGQKHELERRLAEAQGQVQAAQAQLREARAQADQLRAQAQRAEQLAAENAQLKSRQGGSDKLSAELATEKAKVAQLQGQVTALQKTAEGTSKLAQDLQAEKAKVRDLEQKLAAAAKGGGDSAKLTQELAAEKAKVQQLQSQVGTLQQAANEAVRAGAELATARAKVQDLENRIKAMPAAAPAAAGGGAELDRLKTENIRLNGEVDLLKRSAISPRDLEAAQKKAADAAIRVRLLEQRAAELDYYANENSDLRRRLDELEAIAIEAKQMRRRIIDLEAQAFAMTAARSLDKAPPSQAPISQAPVSFRSTDKRLETLLEEGMQALIREETGGRAVVLADTRGLVIAAAGEARYQNELAAASSVAADVSDRIRNLLPFSEAAILHMVDVNSVVMRTRWLRWQEETLALSVLGFRDEPPDPTEDKVIKSVARLMGYG